MENSMEFPGGFMENSMSLTCKGTWGSEVGAKEGPHILHLSSSWDPSVCYWMFGGSF